MSKVNNQFAALGDSSDEENTNGTRSKANTRAPGIPAQNNLLQSERAGLLVLGRTKKAPIQEQVEKVEKKKVVLAQGWGESEVHALKGGLRDGASAEFSCVASGKSNKDEEGYEEVKGRQFVFKRTQSKRKNIDKNVTHKIVDIPKPVAKEGQWCIRATNDKYGRKADLLVAGPFNGDGSFYFRVPLVAGIVNDMGQCKVSIRHVKFSAKKVDQIITIKRLENGVAFDTLKMGEKQGKQTVFLWKIKVVPYVPYTDPVIYDELTLCEAEIRVRDIDVTLNRQHKHRHTPSARALMRARIEEEKKVKEIREKLERGHIDPVFSREYEIEPEKVEAPDEALIFVRKCEKLDKELKNVGDYLSARNFDFSNSDNDEKKMQFLKRSDVQEFLNSSILEKEQLGCDADAAIKNLGESWATIKASAFFNQVKVFEYVDFKGQKCVGVWFGKVFANFDSTIVGKDDNMDVMMKNFEVKHLVNKLRLVKGFSESKCTSFLNSTLFKDILYRVPNTYVLFRVLFGLFEALNIFENADVPIMNKYFVQAYVDIWSDIYKKEHAEELAEAKSDSAHVFIQSAAEATYWKQKDGKGNKRHRHHKVERQYFPYEETYVHSEGKFTAKIDFSSETDPFEHRRDGGVQEAFNNCMRIVTECANDNPELAKFVDQFFASYLGQHKQLRHLAPATNFCQKVGVFEGSATFDLGEAYLQLTWLAEHLAKTPASLRNPSEEQKKLDSMMSSQLIEIEEELKKMLITSESSSAYPSLAMFRLVHQKLCLLLNQLTVMTGDVMARKFIDKKDESSTEFVAMYKTISDIINGITKTSFGKSSKITYDQKKKKVIFSDEKDLGKKQESIDLPQKHSMKDKLCAVTELVKMLKEIDTSSEKKPVSPKEASALKEKKQVKISGKKALISAQTHVACEKKKFEYSSNELRLVENLIKEAEKHPEQVKNAMLMKHLSSLMKYYGYNSATIEKTIKDLLNGMKTQLDNAVTAGNNHGFTFTNTLSLLVECKANMGELRDVAKKASFVKEFNYWTSNKIDFNTFWDTYCSLSETDSIAVLRRSSGLKDAQKLIFEWLLDLFMNEDTENRDLVIGLPTGSGKTVTLMEFGKKLCLWNSLRLAKNPNAKVVNILFVAFGGHGVIPTNFIRSAQDNYVFTTPTFNITKNGGGPNDGMTISGTVEELMANKEKWFRANEEYFLVVDELASVTESDKKFIKMVVDDCNMIGSCYMSGTIDDLESVKTQIALAHYVGKVNVVDEKTLEAYNQPSVHKHHLDYALINLLATLSGVKDFTSTDIPSKLALHRSIATCKDVEGKIRDRIKIMNKDVKSAPQSARTMLKELYDRRRKCESVGQDVCVSKAMVKIIVDKIKFIGSDGRVVRPSHNVFTVDPVTGEVKIEQFISKNPLNYALINLMTMMKHMIAFDLSSIPSRAVLNGSIKASEDSKDTVSERVKLINDVGIFGFKKSIQTTIESFKAMLLELYALRDEGTKVSKNEDNKVSDCEEPAGLTQSKCNEYAKIITDTIKKYPFMERKNPLASRPSMRQLVEVIVKRFSYEQTLVASDVPEKDAQEFVAALVEYMNECYPFLTHLKKSAAVHNIAYSGLSSDFKDSLNKTLKGNVPVYQANNSGKKDKDGTVCKDYAEMKVQETLFNRERATWISETESIHREFAELEQNLHENKTSPELLSKQLNFLKEIKITFLNGSVFNECQEVDGKLVWSFVPPEFQFGARKLCCGGIQHSVAADIYGVSDNQYRKKYFEMSNHGIMMLPNDSNQIPTNPKCAMNDENFYKAISQITGDDGNMAVGMVFCGDRGCVGLNANFVCVIYLGGKYHEQALGRCGRQGIHRNATTISVCPVPDKTGSKCTFSLIPCEDKKQEEVDEPVEPVEPVEEEEKVVALPEKPKGVKVMKAAVNVVQQNFEDIDNDPLYVQEENQDDQDDMDAFRCAQGGNQEFKEWSKPVNKPKPVSIIRELLKEDSDKKSDAPAPAADRKHVHYASMKFSNDPVPVEESPEEVKDRMYGEAISNKCFPFRPSFATKRAPVVVAKPSVAVMSVAKPVAQVVTQEPVKSKEQIYKEANSRKCFPYRPNFAKSRVVIC